MAFCISIVVLILTFHDLEIFLYKKPLTEGERGECKSWLSFLKLSIQKMKIMVSNSITSWKIVWETMQTVTDFIFLDSKFTADVDCSHEIKRCLLLGKSYDQPRQHIKKLRRYFANKGPSGQSCGFSSGRVMHLQRCPSDMWPSPHY